MGSHKKRYFLVAGTTKGELEAGPEKRTVFEARK